MKYFKTQLFILLTLQFLGCNSQGNIKNCSKEQAKHFLNIVDSVRNMHADPPDNLARYLQDFTKSVKQEKYDFRSSQIDSLESLYKIYIKTIDSSLNVISSLYDCKDLDSLKQCCLDLYREEKKMWVDVVPVSIRVFRKGWQSASEEDKTKIASTSLTIKNTVPQITQLGVKKAELYIALHKKYDLKFINR